MSSRLRAISMGWLCLALICSPADTAAAGRTKGKIKKNVYTSPARNFSVPVPPGLGLKITDAYDPTAGIGAVSFHDNFGNQKGILFMRIPAEAIASLENPATRSEALESFLELAAMPTWFHPASPNARIVHQETVGFADSTAFLGLVSIPEGSSMVDVKTGKRLDSSRATLTHYENGYVYVLLTEVGGGVFGLADKEPRSPERQLAAGRKILSDFLAVVRFTEPGR